MVLKLSHKLIHSFTHSFIHSLAFSDRTVFKSILSRRLSMNPWKKHLSGSCRAISAPTNLFIRSFLFKWKFDWGSSISCGRTKPSLSPFLLSVLQTGDLVRKLTLPSRPLGWLAERSEVCVAQVQIGVKYNGWGSNPQLKEIYYLVRAVVVVQLAEQFLSTPEIRGSNTNIGKRQKQIKRGRDRPVYKKIWFSQPNK